MHPAARGGAKRIALPFILQSEEKRPCTGEVMECEWFRFYLRTNGKKLKRKIAVDRRRSAKHLATSSIGVPLYTLDDGR